MENEASAFVYFIQGHLSKRVKIGSTNDPHSRLKTLQTGSPEKLRLIGTIPCCNSSEARSREQELHTTFKRVGVHGEWFDYDDEIIDYLIRWGWISESFKNLQQIATHQIRQYKAIREGCTPCTTASSNYAGA